MAPGEHTAEGISLENYTVIAICIHSASVPEVLCGCAHNSSQNLDGNATFYTSLYNDSARQPGYMVLHMHNDSASCLENEKSRHAPVDFKGLNDKFIRRQASSSL